MEGLKTGEELTQLRILECHLEYPWNFFGICSVHIGVSDWSDMKQFTAGGKRGGLKAKLCLDTDASVQIPLACSNPVNLASLLSSSFILGTFAHS